MIFSTDVTKSDERYADEFTASGHGSIILCTPEFKEDTPEKPIAMIGTINKFIAISLVFVMSLSNATLTLAQSSSGSSSPDTRSPVIELEAIGEAQADTSQVFTVQVVDDRLLKDVILYHRRDGQQAFSRVEMNPLADSAFFTATLTTDPADLRSIQYYIQARDEGGNRTVQGYAFDPYTRVLIANNTVIEYQPIEPANTVSSSNGGVRWWHIALGVVLAGALVSAASGGDSGGAADGTVPLTVNVTGLQ